MFRDLFTPPASSASYRQMRQRHPLEHGDDEHPKTSIITLLQVVLLPHKSI